MKLKANRNISVSKGHGYDFQKVKFAMDFVNKAGRNTTINDWVDAYNYIKGTNETAQGCQACKAAKFTAAVRNYAQYGYLTLINFGYKPDDFKDQPKVEEPCTVFTENENSTETTENGCETEKQSETVAEPSLQSNVEVVEETSPETCNEEQQVPELFNEVKPLAEEVEKPVAALDNNVEGAILAERQQPVVKHNKGGRPRKVKK